MKTRFILFALFYASLCFGQTSVTSEELPCNIIWQDAVYGTCIGGFNSLTSVDLENDGVIEIFARAFHPGLGDTWYEIKYDAEAGTYYRSFFYDEVDNHIRCFAFRDVTGDGVLDIFMGSRQGVKILDGVSRDVIELLTDQLDGVLLTERIILGDADNDGAEEVVVLTRQETYLFSLEDFSYEQHFSVGARDFKLGNIDADANLELVYTDGEVFELVGMELVEEWDFNPSSNFGYVVLSDIDNDGMEEIIKDNASNGFYVYDGDLQAIKFIIETGHNSEGLLLQDITGDQIDEIIYGDDAEGGIYAIDAISHEVLWSIENGPDEPAGVTGIVVEDLDNDGQLEVAWASGCTSTIRDNFHIYDLTDQQHEFESLHIDGPFNDLEYVDVDEDGQLELITTSFESNNGINDGIISIYDAVTKELEWQSEPGFFLPFPFGGIYEFEVADIGADGDLDIVTLLQDKIWVIDGDNHNIESQYTVTSGGSPFPVRLYNLEVLDIDQDNVLEYIISDGNGLQILNSLDYSLEAISEELGNFGLQKAIRIGNIDMDPELEIVFSKGPIYVFDQALNLEWQTVNSNYLSLSLNDVDNDGVAEILAGNPSGTIDVIDGQTQTTQATLSITSNQFDQVGYEDFNGDGQFEYWASSRGIIYIYVDENSVFRTPALYGQAGNFEGFSFADYDNDGQINFTLGNQYRVMELEATCFECINFDIGLTSQPATCQDTADGTALVTITEGQEPFGIEWSSGDTLATAINLAPGIYTVTVTDDYGCQRTKEVEVSLVPFEVEIETLSISCDSLPVGSAQVLVS